MNLYKIMLVDDEEEVRKSIIRKIDWEEIGFEVVGDAENGREALEQLDFLEPDVVLTDIRMPYMDGLTMAQRMRKIFPSMKIVVFSGYDDFEYAQQAIKLNVTEYILKPINVGELTAILKKIKDSLDSEIAQRRNIDTLRESFQKNLPILKEHFLDDLLHDRVKSSKIPSLLREYNIDIQGSEGWVVSHVTIDRPTEELSENTISLHNEEELIPISVKQLVDEKVGKYCRFVSLRTTRGIGVIAALDDGCSLVGLTAVLNDICRECKRILELDVTIGMGKVYTSIEEIYKSYKESKEALGYRAVRGVGSVIYINDVEPAKTTVFLLDAKSENDLISAIKFGGKEEISAVTDEIISRMDEAKLHMSQYQIYIIGIMNVMLQIIHRYELSGEDVFGGNVDYFKMLSSITNLESLQRWIYDVAVKISNSINAERDNAAQNIIREAKIYIQENCQNPQLSLETICKHLHISSTYFSTVFKRETGQSYVAYLTQVRLEKAVQLLTKTDDKTYVIAAKVGYEDSNYFGYVFKKQYGVSPSKYRGH